jgi:hypothetical protein
VKHRPSASDDSRFDIVLIHKNTPRFFHALLLWHLDGCGKRRGRYRTFRSSGVSRISHFVRAAKCRIFEFTLLRALQRTDRRSAAK